MDNLLIRVVIEGKNPSITQLIIAAVTNMVIIPAQIFGYAYLISYAAKLAWN